MRNRTRLICTTFGALLLSVVLPGQARAGQGPESAGEGGAPDNDQVEAGQSASKTGEYGPFFEEPPVSEVSYPTEPARSGQPLFGVGQGAFCFVEDSGCRASLIADFGFGAGMNVVGSDRGLDVPMTEWRVRGGFTVRPFHLATGDWHRWTIGATASFSQASGQVAIARADTSDTNADVIETDPLRTTRVALINQLWMSQKRNALHIDFNLGAARSTVLNAGQQFWGTHAEVGVGWGGLAGFYASTDFLDQDLRAIFGFRTHAGIAGPIIGLVALGLVAGGAR